MRSRSAPRLLVLASLATACRDAPAPSREPSPDKASASASILAPSTSVAVARPSATPASPALPPLAGDWIVDLAMPPGRRAVATLPIGATGPRPVVVGVHGAGDRAEWACGGWRLVTKSFAFVVCPEGRPSGPVFVTADAKRLEADIDAALVALRERFGAHVAPGKALYAGFSLGAIRAPQLLASSKAFSRAVLLEGGYESWSSASAKAFRENGGERAMLVCAGKSCGAFAGVAGLMRQAGIEVEVRSAGTGRHNLDAEMIRFLEGAWPAMVEGDARWAGWRE